jgi:hypothetical protein
MRLDPRAPLTGALQHLAWNVAVREERIRGKYGRLGNEGGVWWGDARRDLEALARWSHEDTAGNPQHIALVGLTGAAALLAGARAGNAQRWYALALLVSFFAYAWAVDHGPYRVRYQVLFLAIGAPLVAVMAEALLTVRLQRILIGALLLLALPWLFLNRTRPLVSAASQTRIESILTVPTRTVLFVNLHKVEEPYSAAAVACSSRSVSLTAGVLTLNTQWNRSRSVTIPTSLSSSTTGN